MHGLHSLLAHYGIWAVPVLLLLENAGLPLPGEATLLYAAYLAHHGDFATWPVLALVAWLACTVGDNVGYWLGREAGVGVRRLLRLSPDRVGYAQRYFARYGALTIFFARFIAILRVIAGPAAGLSRMPWLSFLSANALGAAAWVAAIITAGFWLGGPVARLLQSLSWVSLALLAAAIVAVAVALHKIGREIDTGATHGS